MYTISYIKHKHTNVKILKIIDDIFDIDIRYLI